MAIESDVSTPKERILQSAVALFSAQGFGSTSVKAIAQHAGVSQGLMYTYFSSKDDLLRFIFELGMRDVAKSLELSNEDPLAAIEELVYKSFAIVNENQALWQLIYALRAQPATLARLSVEVSVWTGEIEARLTELCRRANLAHPEIEAKVLFAFIDGANQHKTLFMPDYPVEKVVPMMMQRYRT